LVHARCGSSYTNRGRRCVIRTQAVARLRKSAKKTKEILSANNFAPVSVEGLHDDVDFRSEIYRDAFEKMAAPVFARCAKPLSDLIEQTGVDMAEVEAVELLGGGTRIPGVVAALTAALGGRTPDRCVCTQRVTSEHVGCRPGAARGRERMRNGSENDPESSLSFGGIWDSREGRGSGTGSL